MCWCVLVCVGLPGDLLNSVGPELVLYCKIFLLPPQPSPSYFSSYRKYFCCLLAMALSIRPAVEADLPKVASLIMEADAAHPIIALPWTDLEVAYQFFLEHFTRGFSEPLNHMLVAVDSVGDIAGYLGWHEPGPATKINPIFPEGTKAKVFQTWQAAQANKEEFRTADAAGMYSFVYFCNYFISRVSQGVAS